MTRQGLDELEPQISGRLAPHPPCAGEALLFTQANIQRWPSSRVAGAWRFAGSPAAAFERAFYSFPARIDAS